MSSVIINLKSNHAEILKNGAKDEEVLVTIISEIVHKCCRGIGRDYFVELAQKIFISNIEVEIKENEDEFVKGEKIHLKYKVGIVNCESKSYLNGNELTTSMNVIC